MWKSLTIWLGVAGISSLLPWAMLASANQAKKPQVRQRAKLPDFSSRDAEEYFFPNVFEKLNGDRPSSAESAVEGVPERSAPEEVDRGDPWSQFISATTITDEIKARKILIDKNVTTPSDFAGRGHKPVRRDHSLLAVLFAIVEEYDGDIRFQRSAAVARARFARAASNAKAGGSLSVYNEAKLRKQDLQDLVGGGRLSSEGRPPAMEWAKVVNRTALMQRLELASQERLTPFTRDAETRQRHRDEITHESELVSAIAHVLTKEGVEDGDDEDYAKLARAMQVAAQEMAAAMKRDDSSSVRAAAGQISKACADCHELYR